MKAVSPVQRDLLGTVRVLGAVDAAAVIFGGDVEATHLSSGGGLFHAEHRRKTLYLGLFNPCSFCFWCLAVWLHTVEQARYNPVM